MVVIMKMMMRKRTRETMREKNIVSIGTRVVMMSSRGGERTTSVLSLVWLVSLSFQFLIVKFGAWVIECAQPVSTILQSVNVSFYCRQVGQRSVCRSFRPGRNCEYWNWAAQKKKRPELGRGGGSSKETLISS